MLQLILFQNGSGKDITALVLQIKWQGRKNTAARSLTVSLLDDDGVLHERSGIDVLSGSRVIFNYGGEELFRGIITNVTQDGNKILSFTAYDNAIYLANNEDTFVYENKTASQIFADVCERFGLPIGENSMTNYSIPNLTKPKSTAIDAILDALSQEFKATGIRHYVSSHKEKISLLTRRENILQWVLETHANISNYTYQIGIDKIKTRVKLVSNEGTAVAQKADTELESKIGVFQKVDTPDENLTQAQINGLITEMFEESKTPERTLSITALGKPDIISGIGVFIIIPHLGLNQTFYVDEDTHMFTDQFHEMSLKLNFAGDIEKGKPPSTGGDYKIGETVWFLGGSHNYSSGGDPRGGEREAGWAKITHINLKWQFPYHLLYTQNSKSVYGWVLESQFERR